MADSFKRTKPAPGLTAEHDLDTGAAPVWLAEPVLPSDPRIMPDGRSIPRPVVEPAPATLDEVPLAYGLVAKVLLPRPAFNFKVEHDLPAGVTLVEAKPRATVVGDHLIWNLGRLDPGYELRLQVVVLPEPGARLTVGELTSFTATYSQNLYFQTPVVRPRLAVVVTGPQNARVGDVGEYTIEARNVGNWTIEHARAGVAFSGHLTGVDGPAATFALGTLDPGASRKVTVYARATRPGEAKLRVDLAGTHDTRAVAEFSTEVSG